MLERAVERYRAINRVSSPEDSKGFRLAVLLTVLLSVAAAVTYGAVGLPAGIAVLAGVAAGSYFSWRRRNRANLLVKVTLSVLLLVVFALFWSELSGSIHDLRYPLVRLFLWLQVLHSFDLPARRDLDFSLVSSAVLMAFAGSLSVTDDFLYLLVPFFACGLLSLYLGHRSALRAHTTYSTGTGRSPALRLALTCLLLLPLTLGLFMVMPRLSGFNSYYLPVSRSGSMPSGFNPIIRNPGYEDYPGEFPATPLPFSPDSYFGFNKFMDLRVRGVPADTTVMKVRSDEPAYWRATAFDRFLGNGWENTEKESDLEEVDSDSLPLNIGYPGEPGRYATREVVSTFFVERRLPNIMFAPYIPRDVFFPTRVLKVDSMMTVLTPLQLDDGLIYTTVSEVSNAGPEMLRRAHGLYPPGLRERFLQLPGMSPRVAELTSRVTAGLADDYDKAEAIASYLRSNYPYDLGVRKQGDGENAVEFFLFEARRGFCEHFASAMAVMCRTAGVPARVAVGYDTGEFNALTGYYEVSGRDAHAWVEVYFPVFGWVQFDPTPGWTDPAGSRPGGRTWSGFSLVNGIGRALSRVFPAGLRKAVGGAVAAAAGAVARFVTAAWPWLAAGALAALAAWLLLKRSRWHERERSPGDTGPRHGACRLFARMSEALESAGFERGPSQTPLEYCSRAEAALGLSSACLAARLFNRERFAREPSPEGLDELSAAVEAVEREIGARS